jgi:hypothetical protein
VAYILLHSPLAEGDYYPGDLLDAVLRLPDDAWRRFSSLRVRLAAALDQLVGSDDGKEVERLRSEIYGFIAVVAEE